MTSIVQLDSAEKQYGNVQALKGISLTIKEGEVLGLLGHNGAGKTTTMKLILGLITPTKGEVVVLGENPAGSMGNTVRQQLGYLPESVSFYPQLTGREVLRYFAKLKGQSKQHCNELIERVGLTHAADRRVKTYSKGMKQRLGLAQALLGTPRLLLLDEPTVGLDPAATQAFYETIDQLKQQGCAVILCSHVLPGVEKHISKAAILAQGKVRAYGSIDVLRDEAALPVIVKATFTGHRDDIVEALPSRYVDIKEVNARSIELKVAESEKIALFKQLSNMDGLEKLDMQSPTLEQLYQHFNGVQQEGGL